MFYSIYDQIPEEKATKEHLGGKGYGLYKMAQAQLQVPPAIILPTSLCLEYQKEKHGVISWIREQIPTWKEILRGSATCDPLLSVRSGARVSMPGMMDTILNVGLDEEHAHIWENLLPRACYDDCRKRLLVMYGDVVHHLPRKTLEAATYEEAAKYFLFKTGMPFPAADDQLLESILAVFRSWDNERAKTYRKQNNIPDDWGTAVVIQAMVFGNLNDKSATGVLFTRNPDTGENVVVGEYLVNGQGEDVVAGIRTPLPLHTMRDWNSDVAEELLDVARKLEDSGRDMQDIEFTIQNGELFILQTRSAKRSAQAAVRVALDMCAAGKITKGEALSRVDAKALDKAMLPVLAPGFTDQPLAVGIPACSGIVTGRPVYSAEEAIKAKDKVILITEETNPNDIGGMHAAAGVLTMTGGATSHAAVVARGMDKPCVVGLSLKVDSFKVYSAVSIDGATGRVWAGAVPVIAGDNKDLSSFYRLVRETHNYIPVLSPGRGIDYPAEACAFYLGDYIATPKKLCDDIRAALQHVKMVYLDMDLTPAEQGYYGQFMDLQQEAALTARVMVDLFADRVLVAGGGVKAGKGVNSVGMITDLASLVLAKGAVAMSPGFVMDAATEQVLKWKAEEPLQLIALGVAVPGATSVLSDHQVGW